MLQGWKLGHLGPDNLSKRDSRVSYLTGMWHSVCTYMGPKEVGLSN